MTTRSIAELVADYSPLTQLARSARMSDSENCAHGHPHAEGPARPRPGLADRRGAAGASRASRPHGEQRLLSIAQLRPSGLNPRKDFAEAELAELAEFDPQQGPGAADHRPPRPAARRLRDRRRRAALAGGAEGRPAHRAGDRARAHR